MTAEIGHGPGHSRRGTHTAFALVNKWRDVLLTRSLTVKKSNHGGGGQSSDLSQRQLKTRYGHPNVKRFHPDVANSDHCKILRHSQPLLPRG